MTDVKQCPFCGGEVYYRMTTSGVMFFNCIHCNASITFSRTGEDMSPEEAKKRFNRRIINKIPEVEGKE